MHPNSDGLLTVSSSRKRSFANFELLFSLLTFQPPAHLAFPLILRQPCEHNAWSAKIGNCAGQSTPSEQKQHLPPERLFNLGP